jgi:hypothetical protein
MDHVTCQKCSQNSDNYCCKSDANARITRSRDPYYGLMRRIFQEESTAVRGQKFLMIIEERQASGNAVRTDEWESILEELQVSRASFYAMRNKLLGAGLISINNKEYKLSGQFSKDLLDMARWWWTAVLNQPEDNL